jgi:aspartate/methionine/tyrosine aminotransferase
MLNDRPGRRLTCPCAGMYATLLAFLNPGDEVICIEPFFDQYTASIVFNGGKPVYVPLHPPANLPEGQLPEGKDWTVDFDELRCVCLVRIESRGSSPLTLLEPP